MHRLLAWKTASTPLNPRLRGSRWSTTSCSTCAAPSACSSSCARCGRRPTSSPRSTTRTGTEGRFADRNVHSSFLQRLRPSARTFRALLPLYPAAIESFDLSDYDLVVSSSSAWAHAVLCDERTVHVSYCHNPFRYAWNDREQTLRRAQPADRAAFLRGAFRRWRQWDWIAAQRTDRYVANSAATQARIRAYFGREARGRLPAGRRPVASRPGAVGDHYAVVSELMPHKQIEVAVEAFNRLAPAAGHRRRRARRAAGCAALRRARPSRFAGRARRRRRWPRSCRARAR